MSLSIRTATPSDYPAVARIQGAAPEAAQWPVGDYSNFDLLLALADGVPAGFCAYRETVPGETEILNLAVAPEFRRKGVATLLLSELYGRYPGDIFLEVAEDNLPALHLYQKAGWVKSGVRPFYYPGGKSAIVMKKSSC